MIHSKKGSASSHTEPGSFFSGDCPLLMCSESSLDIPWLPHRCFSLRRVLWGILIFRQQRRIHVWSRGSARTSEAVLKFAEYYQRKSIANWMGTEKRMKKEKEWFKRAVLRWQNQTLSAGYQGWACWYRQDFRTRGVVLKAIKHWMHQGRTSPDSASLNLPEPI